MSEQRGETKPRRVPRADSARSKQRSRREERRDHLAPYRPARREHNRSIASTSIFDRVGRSVGDVDKEQGQDGTCVKGFVKAGDYLPRPQQGVLTNHGVLGQLWQS